VATQPALGGEQRWPFRGAPLRRTPAGAGAAGDAGSGCAVVFDPILSEVRVVASGFEAERLAAAGAQLQRPLRCARSGAGRRSVCERLRGC
jgi:hypothetical protein